MDAPTDPQPAPVDGGLAGDAVRCPACGSAEWLPIVYGLADHELFMAAEQRKVELGGCCISDDSPTRRCRACAQGYGRLDLAQP